MSELCPKHSSSFTGTAGVPPAQAPPGALVPSNGPTTHLLLALRARGGRDARGPSEELECFELRPLPIEALQAVLVRRSRGGQME